MKKKKSMDANLISDKDLSIIKIKLGKSKRNEKDWSVIKEMLLTHDLIVPESFDENEVIGNVGGAMRIDQMLIAFTNPDDCSRQMKAFSEDLEMTLRWQMKFMPFTDLGNIADDAGLILCIDMITDGRNRFITYSNGRVEASLVGSM